MKQVKARSILIALGLLIGCADESTIPKSYDNNDLELVVANSALRGCSCVFVMEMPEAFCRAWVRASPDVAKLGIDTASKRVESSAFLSFAAAAHFVDEKRGCVLE